MRPSYDPGRSPERPRERTDTLFFWAIGLVVLGGIAANVWSSYTAEAPTMERFLELLGTPRTKICDENGTVLSHGSAFNDANCADKGPYRIVVGNRVTIFEQHDGAREGTKQYVKIGYIDRDAMNRLFNLKPPPGER